VHYGLSPAPDASESPCFIRASIVDPQGRNRRLVGRYVWLPPGFADLRRRELERRLPRRRPVSARREPVGLAKSTPLLMLGDLLGGSEDLFAALARFTGGLHCYATYKLPASAQPGRYRVSLEVVTDGVATGSRTEEYDHFFVEDLRLVGAVARRGRRVARVRNRSPEPVPAHLVDVVAAASGRPRYLERTIELAPRAISEIPLESATALLFYGEYREILVLGGGRGAFCVRNPRLQWREGRGTIHVIAADSAEGAELDGPARQIWLRAGGFVRRDEVRNRANSKTYDEMLRRRLILEIAAPG
jgi:hypothetical protein